MWDESFLPNPRWSEQRHTTKSWLKHTWHVWPWIDCKKSDGRSWNKNSNRNKQFKASLKKPFMMLDKFFSIEISRPVWVTGKNWRTKLKSCCFSCCCEFRARHAVLRQDAVSRAKSINYYTPNFLRKLRCFFSTGNCFTCVIRPSFLMAFGVKFSPIWHVYWDSCHAMPWELFFKAVYVLMLLLLSGPWYIFFISSNI